MGNLYLPLLYFIMPIIMTKNFWFSILLGFGLVPTLFSQRIAHLSEKTILVHNLYKPLQPLPSSIKTYRVDAEVWTDSVRASVTADRVKQAFALHSYRMANSDPDMILTVQVKQLKIVRDTFSLADKVNKKVAYYYRETIYLPVSVLALSRTNDTLYYSTRSYQTFYETGGHPTVALAVQQGFLFGGATDYIGRISKLYGKAIATASQAATRSFDYSSATLSVYAPKGSKASFIRQRDSTALLLQSLNSLAGDSTKNAIMRASIKYWQSIVQAGFRPGKAAYSFYAAALNLLEIHRALEDFPLAKHYARLLIDHHYKWAVPIIQDLAQQEEAYVLYQHYQKTGKRRWAELSTLWRKHVNDLSMMSEAEGYLVLQNGNKVEGTVLDLVENFHKGYVRIRYEKKLNAAVGDTEYHVDNVKELHVEGLHLAIIEWNKQMYLCDIAQRHKNIALYKVLVFPQKMKIPLLPRITFGTEPNSLDPTVQSDAPSTFIHQVGKSVSLVKPQAYGDFSKYFDCREIHQLTNYGYYTINQIDSVVYDFARLCGASAKPSDGALAQFPKGKMSDYPFVLLGVGTGINAFSSIYGIVGTIMLAPRWRARLGIGSGAWGKKVAFGVQYDLRPPVYRNKFWSFSFNYAHSRGFKGIIYWDAASKVLAFGGKKTGPEITRIRQLPVNTVNLSLLRQRLRRLSGWTLEMGYSINWQSRPWELLDNAASSPVIVKNMKSIQPGGVIVGISYQFGIGR